ncbi:secondary thiamine-phosphate synthase enzyme [Fervidobacterium changbaicum]|uniref:YjbQ family protein n=1 Tax=Fervidobacterium changbaicum TaxID=310769 RepID=A0ABX5QT71_9BACT|nr:secondary thiamine-phosphate synthase enzyme YjbQ [Fervidobacterium changbaicum]QAV33670.1 YjbQ family protein [Fervidobacterium changbaicum]SDH64861.1 secondary thiamine-phosphate synthase enzyme [Fervidobacterium changbaicum]
MLQEFSVRTTRRVELVDITNEVRKIVKESGVKDGIVVVYVPHTTCGVTINEHADPSVVEDIINQLAKIVPANAGYRHLEGNSDAHIKVSIVGSSVTIIVNNGNLLLGTWQGVFLCEFDGPRTREVIVKVIEG